MNAIKDFLNTPTPSIKEQEEEHKKIRTAFGASLYEAECKARKEEHKKITTAFGDSLYEAECKARKEDHKKIRTAFGASLYEAQCKARKAREEYESSELYTKQYTRLEHIKRSVNKVGPLLLVFGGFIAVIHFNTA